MAVTMDDDDTVDPTEAHDSESGGGLRVAGNDELDRLDPDQHGVEHGQIDGTPEDGESFFDIVD